MNILNCPKCNFKSKFSDNRHFKKCDVNVLDYPEFIQAYRYNRYLRASSGAIARNKTRRKSYITLTCLNCNLSLNLNIDQKYRKFCTKSCAAKFNNKKSPKRKKALKLPQPRAIPKLKYRTCNICNKIESTTGLFKHLSCTNCQKGMVYRNKCKFTFDLRKYPDKFDLELLREYGMFHPTKNPNGISRDHLFSISDGKRLNISPEIMSHPANCQLLFQSENKRKGSISTITIEQLIERVSNWDCI